MAGLAFFWPEAENLCMPALPEGYERKGRVCSFQLDFDAWELLQAISPTSKSYGRYISELIRRDAVRREEWRKLRETQEACLIEVARD
jgi:hypothetical protein